MELYRKSPLRTRKLDDEESRPMPSTGHEVGSSPIATNSKLAEGDEESKRGEVAISTSSSATSVASS